MQPFTARLPLVIVLLSCIFLVACPRPQAFGDTPASSDPAAFIRVTLAKSDVAYQNKDADAYVADDAADYSEMDAAGKTVVSSKAQKQAALTKDFAGTSLPYSRSAVKAIETSSGDVIATVQIATAYTIMEGSLPVTDVYTLGQYRQFWAKSGSGLALKRSRAITEQVERTEVRDWPGLGQPTQIEPGIVRYDIRLPRQGNSRLWIYLPAQHAGKLGCIFNAPAGARGFEGNTFGEDDRPEQVPYARAGYAVVAYEIDGDLPEHPNDQQLITGVTAYMNADAGIVNARMAIDYALARVPNIDPARLYTAGHSSAATLSLQVAQHDPRIAACIAYAPVCDTPARLGDKLLDDFNRAMPGFRSFIERDSPDNNSYALTCPLFLFHADDDSNVPTDEVAAFFDLVKKTNPNVTFTRVPTGDHYDSMIDQGIPDAIQWLQSLPPPP